MTASIAGQSVSVVLEPLILNKVAGQSVSVVLKPLTEKQRKLQTTKFQSDAIADAGSIYVPAPRVHYDFNENKTTNLTNLVEGEPSGWGGGRKMALHTTNYFSPPRCMWFNQGYFQAANEGGFNLGSGAFLIDTHYRWDVNNTMYIFDFAPEITSGNGRYLALKLTTANSQLELYGGEGQQLLLTVSGLALTPQEWHSVKVNRTLENMIQIRVNHQLVGEVFDDTNYDSEVGIDRPRFGGWGLNYYQYSTYGKIDEVKIFTDDPVYYDSENQYITYFKTLGSVVSPDAMVWVTNADGSTYRPNDEGYVEVTVRANTGKYFRIVGSGTDFLVGIGDTNSVYFLGDHYPDQPYVEIDGVRYADGTTIPEEVLRNRWVTIRVPFTLRASLKFFFIDGGGANPADIDLYRLRIVVNEDVSDWIFNSQHINDDGTDNSVETNIGNTDLLCHIHRPREVNWVSEYTKLTENIASVTPDVGDNEYCKFRGGNGSNEYMIITPTHPAGTGNKFRAYMRFNRDLVGGTYERILGGGTFEIYRNSDGSVGYFISHFDEIRINGDPVSVGVAGAFPDAGEWFLFEIDLNTSGRIARFLSDHQSRNQCHADVAWMEMEFTDGTTTGTWFRRSDYTEDSFQTMLNYGTSTDYSVNHISSSHVSNWHSGASTYPLPIYILEEMSDEFTLLNAHGEEGVDQARESTVADGWTSDRGTLIYNNWHGVHTEPWYFHGTGGTQPTFHYQDVALQNPALSLVDSGTLDVILEWWQYADNDWNIAGMSIFALDENGDVLSVNVNSNMERITTKAWVNRTTRMEVPIGTKSIRFAMETAHGQDANIDTISASWERVDRGYLPAPLLYLKNPSADLANTPIYWTTTIGNLGINNTFVTHGVCAFYGDGAGSTLAEQVVPIPALYQSTQDQLTVLDITYSLHTPYANGDTGAIHLYALDDDENVLASSINTAVSADSSAIDETNSITLPVGTTQVKYELNMRTSSGNADAMIDNIRSVLSFIDNT